MLDAFSDADWAEDWADRRSTTGYVVRFRGTAVSWGAIKQKTVALCTTEAEYMALTETITDVTWVTSILGDFGVTAQKGPVILLIVTIRPRSRSPTIQATRLQLFHPRTL